MTSEYNHKKIIENLDNWVSLRGSGNYIPEDNITTSDIDYSIPEVYGIQQVRQEISKFVEILIENNQLSHVLEIGLGYFGSTHFLWRQFFNHVSTIEYQTSRVSNLNENLRQFYSKPVLNDKKSSFFFGYSYLPKTLYKFHTYLNGKKIDLLFIDGEHRYEDVYLDWKIYCHYVQPGGIIAFHDAISKISDSGVPRFLKDLEDGSIDGIKRKINYIVSSKDCGIAYYRV
jgi:predicted O-methyltransferase YrrM